jgi:hypothetical protein
MLKSREQAMRDVVKRDKQVSGKRTKKGPVYSSTPVGDKTKKGMRDPSIFYAGQSKRKITQKQVIDALVAADGAITVAARSLRTSFQHLKNYIEGNEKIQAVMEGIEESMIDISEGTLRYHIEEEKNLTATIFHLKTKGKRRGYVEDEKRDLTKLPPVTIIYHSPRDPDLLAAKAKQIEDKTIDIAAAENAASAATVERTDVDAALLTVEERGE